MTSVWCFSRFHRWKIKLFYLFLHFLIQISPQNHYCNALNVFLPFLAIIIWGQRTLREQSEIAKFKMVDPNGSQNIKIQHGGSNMSAVCRHFCFQQHKLFNSAWKWVIEGFGSRRLLFFTCSLWRNNWGSLRPKFTCSLRKNNGGS